ncbi:SNF2-related protein [Skermanella stibiiresistens]|uniref:SNF2-related protein n=1 Tax=Skermanella stibiiresistens TaxID=913326 RepID=UPI0012F9DAD8|nr:SNF2-related protein [Skermanella stibiiresistens]
MPLRNLTYLPIVLARHLERESGAGSGGITVRLTSTGKILISYRRYTAFGGVEVYEMARRHNGGWGRHTLQDGVAEAWGMLMPTARKAEDVIDWVRREQGTVHDERHRPSLIPLVRVRPLIRRIGDEARAWSLEIDLSKVRRRGDLEGMHRFLSTAWRWSPPGLGWFSVEEVPDLLVSGGITAEMLAEIRERLAHHGAEVREDQPWGIAEDGVTARLDALGLLHTITANRQDRRCLALPDKCLAHEWPEWRSLLDDLDVDSREERASHHAPPEIDWSRVPGWSAPVASGKLLRDYQRAGIEFIASRGFRAMIGDAMRVGKTAQAIGAVNARGCRRIVAILPRSVVHVWRRQIEEWSHPGEEPRIIEVRGSTNPPTPRDLTGDPEDGRATWVLVTYDTVTPRSESVTLRYREDQQEEIEEVFATAGAADAITRVDADSLKVTLDPDDEPLLRAVEQVRFPTWLLEAEKIRSALTRAGGQVRRALTLWDPDGVILDEAYRIKNPKSARTRTVRALIQAPHRLGLLLSGTLIRNHFDVEGLPMLEAVVALDDHYHAARRAGIDKTALAQTLFKKFMLRRKLSDVRDQLPPKIRETVEIPLGGVCQISGQLVGSGVAG